MSFEKQEQQRRDDADLPKKWAKYMLETDISDAANTLFEKTMEHFDEARALMSSPEFIGEDHQIFEGNRVFNEVLGIARGFIRDALLLEEETSPEVSLSANEIRVQVHRVVDTADVVGECAKHFSKMRDALDRQRRAEINMSDDEVRESFQEEPGDAVEAEANKKTRELLNRLTAFMESMDAIEEGTLVRYSFKEMQETEAETEDVVDMSVGIEEKIGASESLLDKERMATATKPLRDYFEALALGLSEMQTFLEGDGGIKVLQQWLERNPPQKGVRG